MQLMETTIYILIQYYVNETSHLVALPRKIYGLEFGFLIIFNKLTFTIKINRMFQKTQKLNGLLPAVSSVLYWVCT